MHEPICFVLTTVIVPMLRQALTDNGKIERTCQIHNVEHGVWL